MFRLLALLLCLVCSFCLVSEGLAQCLNENEFFAGGESGWDFPPGNGVEVIVLGTNNVLKTNKKFATSVAIAIVEESVYDLAFRVYDAYESSADRQSRIDILWYNVSNDLISETKAYHQRTAQTWTSQDVTVTAPAGATSMKIKMGNDKAQSYWDDLCVIGLKPGGGNGSESCLNENGDGSTLDGWSAGTSNKVKLHSIGGAAGIRIHGTWAETKFSASKAGKYQFNFQFYGSKKDSEPSTFSVSWHNDGGTQLGERIQLLQAANPTEWSSYSFDAMKPTEATYGLLRFENGKEKVYVDDVCISTATASVTPTLPEARTATRVVASTGTTSSNKALGAPDGEGAYLTESSDQLTLEVKGSKAGSQAKLYLMRRDYGDGESAQVRVEGRLEGDIWADVDQLSISNTSDFQPQTVDIWADIDQIRVSQGDGTGDDFYLDAVEVEAVSSNPAAPLCGVFSNGGFESGTSGWWSTGGLQLSSDARSGANAGSLEPGETAAADASVTPGKRYQVSFDAKINGSPGPSWAGVGLKFRNSSNTDVGDALSAVRITNRSYQSFGPYEITIPADVAKLNFWISAAAGGNGDIVVDNYCVTELGSGSGSTGVSADGCFGFTNGGFESGTTDWSMGSRGSLTSDAFDGQSAARSLGPNGLSYSVPVTPGMRFNLSFYAKMSGSGFAGAGVDILDSDQVEMSETPSVTVNSSTYREYSLAEFTVPAGAAFLRPWFYSNSGVTFYFDAVCLERTDVATTVTNTWTEAADFYGLDLGGNKFAGFSFYDFDKDDDLDLALNTHSSTYGSQLYQRNPEGIWDNVTTSLAPELDDIVLERSMVWGDLNNDGWIDFVRNTSTPSSNSKGRSIEIYFQDPTTHRFGNGSGGTVPVSVGDNAMQVDVVVSNGINAEGLGLLDFDADGDLDIIFDNHNFGIDVLRNGIINHTNRQRVSLATNQQFTHATPGGHPSRPLGLAQRAVDGDYGAFVDINDDGWVDIFMRKQDENDFFLNTGGAFTNGEDLGESNNNNKGSNAIYDFDNDGDFDVFWTENGPNQLFRNDFGTWTPLGAGGETGIPTTFSNTIAEAAGGDIDNDGDIDLLLVGSTRSFLYINLLNDPNLGPDVGAPMTFRLDDSEHFNPGQRGWGSLFLDVDADGDLDCYINAHGGNHLKLNGLYTGGTPNYRKDLLYVRVWDNRSQYMQSGEERPALGATVILTDCDGVVLSGLREVSGGNSRGMQNPHDVHFGLPYGRNYNYQVVVKYPMYRRADGTLERKVIRKSFNPSTFGNTLPLVEFRTDDVDVDCPAILEICDNGIDDDGDGYIDCADDDCDTMGIQHRLTR